MAHLDFREGDAEVMIAPVIWLIQAAITIFIVTVIFLAGYAVITYVFNKIEHRRQDKLSAEQAAYDEDMRRNAEREIYAVLQEEIQDEIRWTRYLENAAKVESRKRYEQSIFEGGKIEEMRNDFE